MKSFCPRQILIAHRKSDLIWHCQRQMFKYVQVHSRFAYMYSVIILKINLNIYTEYIYLSLNNLFQLMAKLAEGTGFQIPQAAANALNMPPAPAPIPGMPAPPVQQAPPIATQCFMLSNMFDPAT